MKKEKKIVSKRRSFGVCVHWFVQCEWKVCYSLFSMLSAKFRSEHYALSVIKFSYLLAYFFDILPNISYVTTFNKDLSDSCMHIFILVEIC